METKCYFCYPCFQKRKFLWSEFLSFKNWNLAALCSFFLSTSIGFKYDISILIIPPSVDSPTNHLKNKRCKMAKSWITCLKSMKLSMKVLFWGLSYRERLHPIDSKLWKYLLISSCCYLEKALFLSLLQFSVALKTWRLKGHIAHTSVQKISNNDRSFRTKISMKRFLKLSLPFFQGQTFRFSCSTQDFSRETTTTLLLTAGRDNAETSKTFP